MSNKKNLPVSHLQSHLGYHLRVVSNAVSHAFSKKLASLEVTVAQWVILREMYAHDTPTSPSVVAQMTGLSRGAVSKLIDQLLSKNLVTRVACKDDRRYQDIQLTGAAKKLVPMLAKLADQNDHHFFSVLDENEKKNLLSTLIKIARAHQLHQTPIK